MLLSPLTYPAAFTGQSYGLCMPAELLRPVLGMIAKLRGRSYWATETDWLLGQQLILEIEMSVACNSDNSAILQMIAAIREESQALRREVRLLRGVRPGPVEDQGFFVRKTTELLKKGVDYPDMDSSWFVSIAEDRFIDPVEVKKGSDAFFDLIFKDQVDALHCIEDSFAYGKHDDKILALEAPTGTITYDVIEFLGVKVDNQQTFLPAQMCLVDVTGGVKPAISVHDADIGKSVVCQGKTHTVNSVLLFKQAYYGALKPGAVFRSLRGIDMQVKLAKGALVVDRAEVQIRAASDICSFVYDLDSSELTELEEKTTVALKADHARSLLHAKHYL